jgi:dipeptidyl aminopeptidase/acylaminoacyl peptidase
MICRAAAGVLAVAMTVTSAVAQQPRPLQPEDYYRLQQVGGSQLSPDGRYLLYTVQTVRREQNDRITHVWFADLATGKTQRLSTAGVNSTNPGWTPDGKRVYFTTTRGNESGLHFLNFLEPGGEAYRIPGINTVPNYAPDGTWAVVSRTVAPGEAPGDEPENEGGRGGRGGRGGGQAPVNAPCWPRGTPALTGPSDPATRGKTEADRNCDVYVIMHDSYKRDGTFSFLPPGGGQRGGGGRRGGGGGGGGAQTPGGGRFTQFFRMPADGLEPGQQLVQLTTDATNKSFEAFSPDGKWIVYTVGGGGGGRRGGGPDPDEEMAGAAGAQPQMPEVTIARVPSAGGAPDEIVKVRGQVSGVRLSPNNRQLAFVLTERRRTDAFLRVVDVATGNTVADIARGWKYPVSAPRWTPDGKYVTWLSGIGGQDIIVRAPAGGGPITYVTKERQSISSLSYDARMTKMAYTRQTPSDLPEVFVANADGTSEKQVTHVNSQFLKEVKLSKFEHFSYPGVPHNREWLNQLKTRGVEWMLKNNAPDGERPVIDAWLIYPAEYQEGRKYPLAVFIHGGPHGRYADTFSRDFQMIAAQGIFVLYTNPRGSTNYGQDFQYMTLNAWGIDDTKDILQAVDMVVARGLADPQRLGISGGSYGGFMTNWITSHDQRWKAAITDRSIANWMSFYGVSDASSLVENEFAGEPWPYLHADSGSYLLATMLSPIVWADKVKTPTLIIHSINDYRVPLAEGEQWYRALRKNNVPAKLVVFPDASHGLGSSGEPWLLVRRLKEYVDWFRAYLVDDKPVITTTQSG